MEYNIHSTRTFLALLAVAVTIGTGTPLAVYAGAGQADGKPQHANDENNRKKIREANDVKLRAQEPFYSEHAKALAEQYRETAEIVARQGGNAQPILDAAAHLESQSELVAKVRRNAVPIEIPQPVSHPKVHKK
ncbi:MAG TPA: hypothetical protein VFI43_05025 [Nitrosospira sp.]|nr:hypothetical protein [Nitrosospira sp.]